MSLPPYKVGTYDCYAALPEAARRLADEVTGRNPFVSALWCEAFERRLIGAHQQPYYLVLEADGAVRALLPLLIERHALLGRYRVRAMANFYTTVFEPVTADDASHDAEALAQAVAGHLRDSLPHLALVELMPLRGSDAWSACLPEALRVDGFATRRFLAHANWYEHVAGITFPAYLAERPGRLRNTLVRKRRTLERERGFTIQVLTDPVAIAGSMNEYRAIYAASWKGAERAPAFIEEVIVALAGRGLACLGLLRVAGHAAAAQIWIKMGTVWAVFKLAYDPSYSRYSVGSLLTAAMIEHFLAGGTCTGLDFLSGDDAYKQDWASSRREHWGFEAIAAHSVAGRLLRLKRRLERVRMNAPE